MKRTPIVVPMALLMAVSLAAATPADASPRTSESGQRTEVVAYGDLDLTSPSGVGTLDRRIAQAVERVCSPGAVRDINARMAERNCRFHARRGAIAQRSRALALATGEPIQLSSRR